MDIDTPRSGLGARGARMWAELTSQTTSEADLALIEEACRTADRLDKLDRFLDGEHDAWLELARFQDDDNHVVVIVDKAVGEARQLALALKALLQEIRVRLAARPAAPQGVSGLGAITAQLPAGVASLDAHRAGRSP